MHINHTLPNTHTQGKAAAATDFPRMSVHLCLEMPPSVWSGCCLGTSASTCLVTREGSADLWVWP